jgi:tetratricopeptide (TPR) repeat protein
MQTMLLGLALCGVAVFSLATWLEPWFQSWSGNRTRSANVLQVALGDSRRLFAKHFYVKADAYFHSGYYPTIYDARPAAGQMHMASGTTAGPASNEACPDWLGKPRDWIDRFSRHFYPSEHRHFGELAGAHAGHAHKPGEPSEPAEAGRSGGEEREVLPWLRLSASLDPERPETYLVASYWLRSKLGKVNEAEQFLREGLRENPGDYEILFELGRIAYENRHDPARARNLWELALRRWEEKNANQTDPEILVHAQILSHLAKLEEEAKNYPTALEHLKALHRISPFKESVQKWIESVQAQANQ